MKNDTLKGQYRINEQLRAKEVRIVGDEIEPKVYPIFQALKMAEEKELDLVEISPNAQPPVCRIIDYSKFLYQLKKRQKEHLNTSQDNLIEIFVTLNNLISDTCNGTFHGYVIDDLFFLHKKNLSKYKKIPSKTRRYTKI